jgi:glycosyltransferase involved in cell wall biosynthesis
MFSDPMIYPPTINAANILAEKGWMVYLIGIKHKTLENIELNPQVRLVYFGRVRTGIINIFQYIIVHFRLLFFFVFKKISFCIAYDAGAVSPAYFASKITDIKWCYHNHDLFENPKGWHKLIKYLEINLAGKADIISFPQTNRAEIFKKQAGITKTITIVWNGPRADYCDITVKPDIRELEVFDNFMQRCPKVMIYQGGLSRHFNLNIFLDALSELNSEVGICILGKELDKGIKDEIFRLVKDKSLNERVLVLNGVPYDYLPLISMKCFLGLAKFTSSANAPVNDYYLAGASNKIAEYLACGLPVLAPDTEINRTFFQDYPIGFLCNTDNSLDIVNNVNLLIKDASLYNKISLNNKGLFASVFNFDTQFEKLRIQIDSAIN